MSDAIGRLVADVRQPLTAVIGHLELALEAIGDVPDLPPDAAGHASLRAVRDRLHDARAASRDAADRLARWERDHRNAKASKTDLGPLLDATETLDDLVQDFDGYQDLVDASDAVWRIARELAGQDLSSPRASATSSDAGSSTSAGTSSATAAEAGPPPPSSSSTTAP